MAFWVTFYAGKLSRLHGKTRKLFWGRTTIQSIQVGIQFFLCNTCLQAMGNAPELKFLWLWGNMYMGTLKRQNLTEQNHYDLGWL